MFNFFCSDDFYIITWLDHCKQNISLLFQTVYDGTPYYRPLLNLLLFVEYSCCNYFFGAPNSILFRVLSILYLLVTACILWLFIAELSKTFGDENVGDEEIEKNKKAKTNACLFSTGLFLLYPLHTEPVNWFVCKTELLVSLFILGSFLFFIYWRNKQSLSFQLLSYLFAICAFLTKEIAVILPALLFVYQLLIGDKTLETKQSQDSLTKVLKAILSTIRITAIYWFLLVIYLYLRKMMIGDFLGNWSNAAFHFLDTRMMLNAWWQSIKVILNPISFPAFGQNIFVHFGWTLMLLDLIFLTIASALRNRKRLALLTFLVCWFFISLAPMAKLLLITPDLLDARYGYIASIPLCIFLMLGLAFRNKPRRLDSARHIIFIVVILFCCFILRFNNLMWAEVGNLTNNLLNGFHSIHEEIADSEKIYFLNIPVRYKGVAIAGIQAMGSMNHKPFAKEDHDNCIWLKDEDQSLPIGIMAHDFETGKISARFYYLNDSTKAFRLIEPINLDKGAVTKIDFLNTDKKIIPEKVLSAGHGIRRFVSAGPLELNCWNTDAIIMKVNIEKCAPSFKGGLVQMSLYNDLLPLAELKKESASLCLTAPLFNQKEDQNLVFYLRGKPIWSFGGRCHTILLKSPQGCVISIQNAYSTTLNDNMPKLTFDSADYHVQTGQINLDAKHPSSIIDYDASFIENCAGVVVEAIDGSEYFRDLNSQHSDSNSVIDLRSMEPKGQIKMYSSLFSNSGYYKMRLRPVDKTGKQCAFCSDHFILHVIK